jgi:hypothetical protein
MSLTVARDTLERAPLPGDVFLLNWPRLGIDQMVVRVTGIDTGTLGRGRVAHRSDGGCVRDEQRRAVAPATAHRGADHGAAAARTGAGGRGSVLGTGPHACRAPIWIT